MIARLAFRFFLFVLLGIAITPPGHAQGLESFAASSLSIKTATGVYPIHVELATTEPQREQGLMYRTSLAADAGMLFVYTYPQQVQFWMKNTVIPLDMLFIGGDGHVVSLHERAVPFSEEPIPSVAEAQFVLEVNGGTVDRLGVKPGDLVSGPALAQR